MNQEQSFFCKTRKQGILSIPGESFSCFAKRVENLAENRRVFYQKEKSHGMTSMDYYDDKLKIHKTLFLLESSKNLKIWEAAATWTIEQDKTFLSYIQIKKHKRVSLDEILKHELIHEMRQGFEEKVFEEFLAYKTSKSFFRRWFGPIFLSSKESLFFVLFFNLLLIVFFITDSDLISLSLYVSVGLLFFRLAVLQYVFCRCLKKISRIFQDIDPLSLAVCLTDREIVKIAFNKKISDFFTINYENSPRWQQILDTFT
jgi:hypothetical protein